MKRVFRILAVAYSLALVPLMWLPLSMPVPALGIDWVDKLEHAVAYAGLSLIWLLGGATSLMVGLMVWLWSALLECGQLLAPGREFSLGDLLANTLGVILALLLWQLWPRSRSVQ